MAMMPGSAGGKRGRRGLRRGGLMSDINVTPMVDVMLVLLIIFMVAAPLLTSGVPIDLPQTAAQALATESKPITVTVRPDGALYLGEDPVAADALLAEVNALAGGDATQRLYIRGDATAAYGAIMEVMGTLSGAGYAAYRADHRAEEDALMRRALPASVLVHLALLGGAWLALDLTPPPEDTGLESVTVDILNIEEFASSSASTAVSSATEALVAAGAEAVPETEVIAPTEPVTAEPVQPVSQAVETAAVDSPEPIQPDAARPSTTEAAATDDAASLAVLAAATVPDSPPVEGLVPVRTAAVAFEVAPAAPAADLRVAAVAPQMVEPVSTTGALLQAIEDKVAPTPLPRPVFKQQAAPPPQKPSPRADRSETPRPKPKAEPKPKAKPSQAGDGGESNATVAAAAQSGGKGASTAAGNAAVSKYPGLVQRALRRALRFPKGAGSARGEVQVTFVVSSSGAASQIAVTRSSGHAVLDREAIATVKRAAPFPAIPAAAGRSSWTFTMPLAFLR